MTTKSIISAIIHAKNGWAVAEQFEDTWQQDEPFEEQNGNALRLIESACAELLETGVLAEKPYYQVVAYLHELRQYLNSEK